MKKTATFVSVVLIAAACAQTSAPGPVETALINKIAESVSPDAVITIDNLEKVDSTTFGTELERRIHVFTVRHERNENFYQKYKSEGKRKNAALKKEAMEKDILVLEGLNKIAERMGDSLNVVAYYDYKFSGCAETETQRTVFQDYYASITPDCQIMSMGSSNRGLHKALGRVIPGYLDLIGKDLEELLKESEDE